MKLHEMKYTDGAKHSKKRVGRGNGSGYGKTCGRGENGQNSRSGGSLRRGFEGGQNPLYLRLPKRGFSNAPFKKTYTTVSLDDLNRLTDGEIVTATLLKEKKIISKINDGVKVLGTGTLSKKLTLKLDLYTKTAQDAIVNAGGNIEEK